MSLEAGVGIREITPVDSQFLFGYPHVERYSTGVHDPLLSTALCLSDGERKLLIIANDIIFIDKRCSTVVREALTKNTGIPVENILVSATHTHSGPLVMDYLSNADDPAVPRTDKNYLRLLEKGIIDAGTEATAGLKPVEIGLGMADATGVGTNRRDPDGPSDMDVPVLAVRALDGGEMMALMLVCSMHPTVLHEDSRLVSADFPGMTRDYLHRTLGESCAVVYHTGCEGNQSPRHVTRENSFAEAERLGGILGSAVEKILPSIEYRREAALGSRRAFIELPERRFPGVEDSEKKVRAAVDKFETLRRKGDAPRETRTAECDLFGAEETLTLSRAQENGLTEAAREACMPCEIQLLTIGGWAFAAWPGELFIEFGLAVRSAFQDTFVINLANGELQGYITTEEAALEGGYEASNALFSHQSGDMIVTETVRLLKDAGIRSAVGGN